MTLLIDNFKFKALKSEIFVLIKFNTKTELYLMIKYAGETF